MSGLLLKALAGENLGRPPVWLMRQAGRYMPEYQKIKQRYSLWQMFHEPELAAKITLLPIELLGVDAAIVFSDILVLAEAFGKKIVFPDSRGPYVEPYVQTLSDIQNLQVGNLRESLSYVAKTIALLRPTLSVPLIGFSAAPFTMAAYMIEGAGRGHFAKTKELICQSPEAFARLLDTIADATIDYHTMQIEEGVSAIQVFDSWAEVVTEQQFAEFCLPPLKKISRALQSKNIPMILFARGSSYLYPLMAQINSCALSIDEKGDLSHVRKVLGDKVALQGNLSPILLRDGSQSQVLEEAKKILTAMQGDKAFIFNLGHGVLPATPVSNVQALIHLVKSAR
jgi:uroporphyrinogen decarboxylase